MKTRSSFPAWTFYCLMAAGIYNIVWGIWVGLFPNTFFELASLELPTYPVIWQGMGMVIGLYGLGYIIAAFDPIRHWAIILIGFLGKVLGPLGYAWYAVQGKFPFEFIYIHITNDFIWLIPFGVILLKVKHQIGRRK